MPRANRHHIPGHIWHITHRCHKREFLLKFSKDKKRWLYWLFEAKKRFGLCILSYMVTSNHIHLLVSDTDEDVIPKSIQLAAGRTGQEYNTRKKRKGAFWDDRYHATAVESDKHLIRCLVYIDLNMVRAGAVKHPSQWPFGSYNEISRPKQRYSLISRNKLMNILGMADESKLGIYHEQQVEEVLKKESKLRESEWTESIAVGSRQFVEKTKIQLGIKVRGRKVTEKNGIYNLKESQDPYSAVSDPEKVGLSAENSYFWNEYGGITA